MEKYTKYIGVYLALISFAYSLIATKIQAENNAKAIAEIKQDVRDRCLITDCSRLRTKLDKLEERTIGLELRK